MTTPGKLPLDDEIGEYLNHLTVERGLAGNTISAYRRDLGRYRTFCASRQVMSVSDVTTALVGEYLMDLRTPTDGKTPAETTVGRALVAVRRFHAFAAAEGFATADPAAVVTPPTPPARLPQGLSIADTEALLEAPDPHTPAGLRDRAILELLYGTGIRVSELTGADVDDLHAVTRTLTVTGKGDKQRIVPVGRAALQAVEAYVVRVRPGWAAKGRGTPALFLNTRGGRLTRQSVWAIIRAAADTADIRDVHPHTLRHSFATHLLQGGADIRVVQELLGHASVTTTQVYTRVTIDHLREVYATAHPRGH